jgi:predicted nucleic acid-binding protein
MRTTVDLDADVLQAAKEMAILYGSTDIYLLGLAKKRGGTLVTFDRTIPLEAVKGATRATLTVLSPVET